jgi:hypothetical protein
MFSGSLSRLNRMFYSIRGQEPPADRNSRSDPNLNNAFLSAQNGKVGIYGSDKSDASRAARVFSSRYDASQTLSLHIADNTHQMALVGSNGLLELVDVVNPTADTIPQGQAMEWSTFVIDGQGKITIKDGADIPTRQWVAYEIGNGDYGVGLYDGVTVPQSRQFQNITILARNI